MIKYSTEIRKSAESKAIIVRRNLNDRFFSCDWDARYGNVFDPTHLILIFDLINHYYTRRYICYTGYI